MRGEQLRVFNIVVAALLFFLFGAQRETAQAVAADKPMIPRFAVRPLGRPLPHKASTIPVWSSSFSYQDTIYPYTMVGTNPAAGSAITTIPTEIIPLRFIFADGFVFDGSSKVTATVDSPIFRPARFESGTTQYGDAMQRANFWSTISATSQDWHVLLEPPTVWPKQTLVVPSDHGYVTPSPNSGQPVGVVDDQWLSDHINSLMASLHVEPTTLPIFLAYNTFFTSSGVCCFGGYHGADSVGASTTKVPGNENHGNAIHTFIFATYMDPNIYPEPFADVQDVSLLSHEVAEWLTDPFIQNKAPSWITELTGAYYGCSDLLEVGDPLVGVNIRVRMPNGATYHPQDMAFVPWFARTPTSSSLHRKYTYLGYYRTFSPAC